jgi:hypothetical protein
MVAQRSLPVRAMISRRARVVGFASVIALVGVLAVGTSSGHSPPERVGRSDFPSEGGRDGPESCGSGETARRRVRGRRQRVWLTLFGLGVGVITAGLGTAEPAHAASTIAVDCTTDSSALRAALMSATDGDTLAIHGTCKGAFEIAHSLTLAGGGGATPDDQGAGTIWPMDKALSSR